MDILEAINHLPPELRGKILKEAVAAKIKDKKRVGWDKVHRDLFLFFEVAMPLSQAAANVIFAGGTAAVGLVG